MTNNATGESRKQSGLINQHVAIKRKLQIITNRSALLGEIIPRGISRIAVLGFFASKYLSKYRLNAIAALLAVIIQIKTSINRKNIISVSNEFVLKLPVLQNNS